MRTLYQKKMIRIGILIMIIGGLSIGFAAFSSTLNIKAQTTVSPDPSGFNVSLSNSEDSVQVGEIIPTSFFSDVAASSSKAVISADGKSISNIMAAFTKPGQSVIYKFYAINNGKLTATLKNYGFHKSDSEMRVCVPGDDTSTSLVNSACEGIIIELNRKATGQDKSSYQYFPFGKDNVINNLYGNNLINPNEYIEFQLLINYKSSAERADGPFTVQFSDLLFEFSS